MNAKQTSKDDSYVYSSFKQFCLPVLEFLVPQLCTVARYRNVITVIFPHPEMLGFVN